MALRRMSLLPDIEHEIWLLLEEMRTEHDIEPSDAHAYLGQAWAKVRKQWEQEHPETEST